MCHAVPYRRFTRLMMKKVVEGAIDLINAFPSKNKIVENMSPAKIVEGKNKIDYLSIDTEGSEIQIINGINFDKIDVTLISMEVNYEIQPVTDFMKSKNYKFIQKICGDAFYTKI